MPDDTTLPPDPGMGVKMNHKSLGSLDAALAGRGVDAAAVEELCDFVDARYDCADFRLVTILKLLLADPGLPDGLRERMKASVLGFKYWMDEPGDDGMCFWSENHQALFAVCEYLAGQLYPDETFTNNGATGAERRERGRVRFERWLGHRFRHGFTEWCSNTYYEEDAAALALFIDHADDPALVTRASMVMDLLLLDMAIHRFGGRFVGSSGRCYEDQKKDPAKADVNDILAHFLGGAGESEARAVPDLTRISSVVVLGERYAMPEVLRAIADDPRPCVTRTTSGLDLDEVNRVMADPMDVETTGAFMWLAEAFTNVESIDVTVKAFERWHMAKNRFLAPLAPFAKLARIPGFVRAGGLRALVRVLNPATQGVAIQRANVYTHRTPHHHLSAAVHHHAGEFGDQQHIWQATLPGDVTVFATHPGAPMFDNNARNFSPSYWVGNGRNPEVAQHEGTLVALYDTRGRKGYLERERQQFTHLYLPFGRLDEHRRGERWVVGRVGESYVGVLATEAMEQVADDELVQRGAVTGWGVILGDAAADGTLDDFEGLVREATLVRAGDRLTLTSARGELAARWRKGGWRDGVRQAQDHARYDTPWVRAPRNPSRLEVRCGGHELLLDWGAGTRVAR